MTAFRAIAVGFAVGTVATVPMSAFFALARRADAIDELPPHKLARSLLPERSSSGHKRAAALVHLAIGGSAGAGYLALRRREPPSAATGAAFAVGVWLVGYELVVPGLTDMPRAHRDRRPRAVSIFIAHLVYGASLGLVARALGRRHVPRD